MATAYSRAVFDDQGVKSIFGDQRTGRGHWSDLFWFNPTILQPGDEREQDVAWIPHYPGCRPYIDYPESDSRHFAFKPDHLAVPGELYFTDAELLQAKSERDELGDFILIEPHVKGTVSADNKRWPFDRFQALVERFPDRAFAQFDTGEILDGVNVVSSETFRQACAVLSFASGFIGTDGGLHHAAAALKVPAVVIWGGYSSPDILGYLEHQNIFHDHPDSPCGSLTPCPHCDEQMGDISVDEVSEAVRSIL